MNQVTGMTVDVSEKNRKKWKKGGKMEALLSVGLLQSLIQLLLEKKTFEARLPLVGVPILPSITNHTIKSMSSNV